MLQVRELVQEKRLRTLYIGGGTPTILGNRELKKLFEFCGDYLLPFSSSRSWEGEFTVEANPGTLDSDKGRILVEGGVNRVSLGAQSFDDRFLETLGRVHKSADILKCVRILRDEGLLNLNIDLIFGLPDQSVDQWKVDLEKGLGLFPDHFSIYNLTLAQGTPFYDCPPPLPSEENQIRMMELTENTLQKAGYRHYEISNYAKSGKYSRHNMVYWEGGEYIGLGPGAHSYYENKRFSNVVSVEEYIQKISSGVSPVAFSEKITAETKVSEALMLGLRLSDGVSEQVFRDRFGSAWEEKVSSFFKAGFLEHVSGRVRFTGKGMLVADEVIVRLI